MTSTEHPIDASVAPVIELRDIRAVAIIAEERSITRAAVRLNIAQPALSRRIRAIETRLGVRLFQRTPTGVEPTAGGKVLLEQGGDLIAASHRLLEAIRSSGVTTRELRVGAMLLGGVVPRLRQAIHEFHARHPDVVIRPATTPSPGQAAAVIRGDLDIGFGYEPLTHDKIGSHLLLTEHIGSVLIADDHPLASRSAVTMAELEELDTVMPSPQHHPVTYQRLHEAFLRAGRRRAPRVLVESAADGVGLVTAGLAFAVALDSMREAPLARIRQLPVEGLSIELPLYVYAPRWSDRPEIEAFLELLRAA